MPVIETILWKSIPWPGHESARLLSVDAAWQLEGTAAFLNDGDPCRLDYSITCEDDWRTRNARVNGWIANRAIAVTIEVANGARSEERRVGKECRSRGSPDECEKT